MADSTRASLTTAVDSPKPKLVYDIIDEKVSCLNLYFDSIRKITQGDPKYKYYSEKSIGQIELVLRYKPDLPNGFHQKMFPWDEFINIGLPVSTEISYTDSIYLKDGARILLETSAARRLNRLRLSEPILSLDLKHLSII